MLAAAALSQAAELVARRTTALKGDRPGLGPYTGPYPGQLIAGVTVAVLTAVVLVQPLAADIRSAQVLGRDDTRQEARDWIEARYPPELRASVEPTVPGRWFRSNPDGDPPSWLTRCPRRDGWTEPGWSYMASGGQRVCAQYKPGLVARPDGGIRASAYHAVLDPGVIDDYRLYGYCLVMTADVVQDRALQTGDRDARAYYARLARESRVVKTFSPYDAGADPVPFSFDLSYNYYPPEYHRPGPDREDPPPERLPPGDRPADHPRPAGAGAGALLAERAQRAQRVALEEAVHGAPRRRLPVGRVLGVHQPALRPPGAHRQRAAVA